MKRTILLGLVMILGFGSEATVHPASLFTDPMVLQREKSGPVWGTADPRKTVVFSSPDVETPVAVRYNWANNPVGNLYNQEGLPASLFRTDRW